MSLGEDNKDIKKQFLIWLPIALSWAASMCILRYARGYTSYLLLVWLGKEDWSPSISVFTPTLYQKYFLTLAETDRKIFYFFEILITFFSLVLAVATMVVVYKVMKKREFNGQRKNNK